MIVPVIAVREGCVKIAENIAELADYAGRILEMNEGVVSRRIAYILVVHAMDEAGKLLTVIKEMIKAESSGAETIAIEGFYNHEYKGSQAGGVGLLTIDWFQTVIDRLPPPGTREGFLLCGYRNHLEHLRHGFSKEREDALYVDFDQGKWISPNFPEEGCIALDSILLGFMAVITQTTIGTGKSFLELDKMIRLIAAPATMEAFVKQMRDRLSRMAEVDSDAGRAGKST